MGTASPPAEAKPSLGIESLPLPLAVDTHSLSFFVADFEHSMHLVDEAVATSGDASAGAWWQTRKEGMRRVLVFWTTALGLTQQLHVLTRSLESNALSYEQEQDQRIELRNLEHRLKRMHWKGKRLLVLPNEEGFEDAVLKRPPNWYQRDVDRDTRAETSDQDFAVVSTTASISPENNSLSSSTRSASKRGVSYQEDDDDDFRVANELDQSLNGQPSGSTRVSKRTASTAKFDSNNNDDNREVIDLSDSPPKDTPHPPKVAKTVVSSSSRSKPARALQFSLVDGDAETTNFMQDIKQHQNVRSSISFKKKEPSKPPPPDDGVEFMEDIIPNWNHNANHIAHNIMHPDDRVPIDRSKFASPSPSTIVSTISNTASSVFSSVTTAMFGTGPTRSASPPTSFTPGQRAIMCKRCTSFYVGSVCMSAACEKRRGGVGGIGIGIGGGGGGGGGAKIVSNVVKNAIAQVGGVDDYAFPPDNIDEEAVLNRRRRAKLSAEGIIILDE
ncbi:UNVERIFIED_CONTAM: hypothetical protein HDU68_002083 [Siphonaria sp. JEL0065]|nr:hypothetical protein HDU68_002083 [Siphonaria sp. JEL0065]